MQRIRDWARRVRRDLVALYHAARDPRTPWIARLIAVLVVAYALSPIDLIPDVVPVLGLLDDVIIVPLGLALAMSLIPAELLQEHRQRARDGERLPASRAAAAVVVAVWLVSGTLLIAWLANVLKD